MLSALEVGYRSFDTAQAYQMLGRLSCRWIFEVHAQSPRIESAPQPRWGYHEEEVGEAVYLSGIPREEPSLHAASAGTFLESASARRPRAVLLAAKELFLQSAQLSCPSVWSLERQAPILQTVFGQRRGVACRSLIQGWSCGFVSETTDEARCTQRIWATQRRSGRSRCRCGD